MGAGDGFSSNARQRIEAAVAHAEERSGLAFSVVVGRSDGEPHAYARGLLARVPAGDRPHVLVFVSPGQRYVEVATDPAAKAMVSDEACALAVLSMTTSFAVGDLAGGIVSGVRMLSDASRRPHPTAP